MAPIETELSNNKISKSAVTHIMMKIIGNRELVDFILDATPLVLITLTALKIYYIRRL